MMCSFSFANMVRQDRGATTLQISADLRPLISVPTPTTNSFALHLPFPLLNFFLPQIQQSSPCGSEKHLLMYPPSRSGSPPHLGEKCHRGVSAYPQENRFATDTVLWYKFLGYKIPICTTGFPRDHWSNEGVSAEGRMEGRGSSFLS